MKTEPDNKVLKKMQLTQLDAMRYTLNDIISKVEDDGVSIIEGRMTHETNAGSSEYLPTNELWLSIEYIHNSFRKRANYDDEIDVCAKMGNQERK